MNQPRALGSLAITLALACSGKTLIVDDDPDAGTGGTSSSGSGGSSGVGGTASGTGGATSGTGGAASSQSGGSSSGGSSGSSSGGSAAGGSGGGSSAIGLPCDVLDAGGHPCVAAHSTVRVLRRAYTGPLYQLCLGEAGGEPVSCQAETLDVGAVNGHADAAAHDAFCTSTNCTITIVYDQSGQGNHLEPSPPGSAKSTPGKPVAASALPTLVAGHDTYGMLFRPGLGYRTGCTECNIKTANGTAVDDEPQTIYMVTSQHDAINGCCFDYGNAEITSNNDGNGTAEAVYFGHGVIWGTGSGEGPWVMADLENGLFPGWEMGSDRNISTNTSLNHDFVTAAIVGDTADKNRGNGRFAIYGGDAQSGGLTTMYDGIRPERPGYVPMQKQGSIVLSIAGDNSDGDGGRFYEGVMASGAATEQTLAALQAAIVAANYGR